MEREYNIIREKEYEMNKGSKNEFERIEGWGIKSKEQTQGKERENVNFEMKIRKDYV